MSSQLFGSSDFDDLSSQSSDIERAIENLRQDVEQDFNSDDNSENSSEVDPFDLISLSYYISKERNIDRTPEYFGYIEVQLTAYTDTLEVSQINKKLHALIKRLAVSEQLANLDDNYEGVQGFLKYIYSSKLLSLIFKKPFALFEPMFNHCEPEFIKETARHYFTKTNILEQMHYHRNVSKLAKTLCELYFFKFNSEDLDETDGNKVEYHIVNPEYKSRSENADLILDFLIEGIEDNKPFEYDPTSLKALLRFSITLAAGVIVYQSATNFSYKRHKLYGNYLTVANDYRIVKSNDIAYTLIVSLLNKEAILQPWQERLLSYYKANLSNLGDQSIYFDHILKLYTKRYLTDFPLPHLKQSHHLNINKAFEFDTLRHSHAELFENLVTSRVETQTVQKYISERKEKSLYLPPTIRHLYDTYTGLGPEYYNEGTIHNHANLKEEFRKRWDNPLNLNYTTVLDPKYNTIQNGSIFFAKYKPMEEEFNTEA